jgi:hypothetical protein
MFPDRILLIKSGKFNKKQIRKIPTKHTALSFWRQSVEECKDDCQEESRV